MRKPTICICETKGADQLCSNCTADQHLCFCYTDSTTPLLLKSKISSVTVQADLCQTRSETQIVGFLMHSLNYFNSAVKVACSTTSAKVNINITTDGCVGGECNSHGKCHNYLNGHVLFSTCKCSAGK